MGYISWESKKLLEVSLPGLSGVVSNPPIKAGYSPVERQSRYSLVSGGENGALKISEELGIRG